MTAPRIMQGAAIAVVTSPPAPTRIYQAALITVQGPPNIPTQITQGAMIAVVADGRKYISLGDPIGLDCWQPCSAFGFYGLIAYLGGN